MELISEMKSISSMKELILFDRGYPSCKMISKLSQGNICFVMRLKSNVFKKQISAEKQDQTIEIKYHKKLYTVRAVRFYLESKIEEILITNLFDESLKFQDFKELYFKRWQIIPISGLFDLYRLFINADFYYILPQNPLLSCGECRHYFFNPLNFLMISSLSAYLNAISSLSTECSFSPSFRCA